MDNVSFKLVGLPRQGSLLKGWVGPDVIALTLDGSALPFVRDGHFIVGLDRDAGPKSVLTVLDHAGGKSEIPLTIAPGDWQIETLSTLPRFALPNAEFAKLRPAELHAIGAARAIVTDAGGWRQNFVWPAIGRISGRFGSQRVYANGEKGDYHSGVDIARGAGTPVAAPADGVVILAADHPFTLEGNLLMIDHGMGLNSAFLHLSRIDVHVGDHVRQGQIVGAIGMTGRATGPHLHWAMKWQAARIDPALVAGPMPAN